MSGNEKADLNSTAIFAQRRTTIGQELAFSDLWREAGLLRKRSFAKANFHPIKTRNGLLSSSYSSSHRQQAEGEQGEG